MRTGISTRAAYKKADLPFGSNTFLGPARRNHSPSPVAMLHLRLVVFVAVCLAHQYACCDPKPGTCPSPPRCTDIFDGNVPSCSVDSDCPREEKCCEDACNPGKICTSFYGLGH
ncbi:uncharacterized protein [Penaeus vannamei]|uniref:uncharacterized protein n=1 Tax=Penaeus vannamei TaxID=6689 RepID=UPI00387F804B